MDAANSGKLGMEAMLRTATSFKTGSDGKLLSQKNMLRGLNSGPKDHPLGEHSERLNRGNIFAHWGENGQYVVYATPNFDALSWKKRGSKRAKDVSSVPISEVKSIESGRRRGGHRRGVNVADEDRAFFVTIGSGKSIKYLDLEASTRIERDRWVDAIQTWLDAHRGGKL